MELHGSNLIGTGESRRGASRYSAVDPATGHSLDPPFIEATDEEVDRAARKAEAAFSSYGKTPNSQRGAFLEEIGEHILALGGTLLERAGAETALPEKRLEAERARTVNQLKMFAQLVEEGSWVEARIDRGQPERQPLPKPDIRRMLVPLGPVAVFGASNFPLAFSVAGGDTASALAAGCPVVAKAHPAHPGTSELMGRVILEAAEATGMPEGVFSLLHGAAHRIGEILVMHPAVRAVGFTGSLKGGRALFDLACRRPDPIPVYAEMGSSNPVFVLPRALAQRGEEIATGLAASVTLGGGQFCTNPGVTVLLEGREAEVFLRRTAALLVDTGPFTMVHSGIKAAYDESLERVTALEGVELATRCEAAGQWEETTAGPALLVTDDTTYRRETQLQGELYGPATLTVRCSSKERLLKLARSLQGHLTATIHGTDEDLEEYSELVSILREKVGRLIFNGLPTGVEVCPAMHHGGPYPSTTDSTTTSVGTAAIERFARPVCFQNFPQKSLPAELQDANPLGIWRLVDGEPTTEPL